VRNYKNIIIATLAIIAVIFVILFWQKNLDLKNSEKEILDIEVEKETLQNEVEEMKEIKKDFAKEIGNKNAEILRVRDSFRDLEDEIDISEFRWYKNKRLGFQVMIPKNIFADEEFFLESDFSNHDFIEFWTKEKNAPGGNHQGFLAVYEKSSNEKFSERSMIPLSFGGVVENPDSEMSCPYCKFPYFFNAREGVFIKINENTVLNIGWYLNLKVIAETFKKL
jgi:hypothetical protein